MIRGSSRDNGRGGRCAVKASAGAVVGEIQAASMVVPSRWRLPSMSVTDSATFMIYSDYETRKP